MENLLNLVVDTINKSMLEDIEIIDLREVNPFNDYFIIATARNLRLANSVIDEICKQVKENGYKIKGIEGNGGSDWLLLDLHDVIVHIFLSDARKIYKIESLYSDLKRVKL